MSIYFEINEEMSSTYINEINQLVIEKGENFLDIVINCILDFFQCPYECEVSIYITNDQEIKEINVEQRKIDKSTDVLSFPMIEWEKEADFQQVEKNMNYFHPETGELILGDIIISYDTLLKQATQYGHSKLREFTFLVVHSMLHLLGYDHMINEERIVMEKLQHNIMEQLKITRE